MKYILLLVFLFWKTTFAQTTIQYYPFNSLLGITQQAGNFLAFDYKVETNSFFNNMNMEFGLRILRKKTYKVIAGEEVKIIKEINLYSGAGIAFNPLNSTGNIKVINGYYIDLGIRWHLPFANYININFECSPYINRLFTNGNIRTRLGIGYRLGRK